MTESLDIILSRNCPGKSTPHFNLSLGIFGRRCVYINSRCLVPETFPVRNCIIYSQHNKVMNVTTEKDTYETHMGIGACDVPTARSYYNGR